jgi:diazepam-binding inhibitor (GABA receptor modulator, acyl-CoA-binding protein)
MPPENATLAAMSDLDARFAAASEAALHLPTDPGNEIKLRLYGLFKQATQGDPDSKRPGFTNPVGRAKHDAWAAVAGTGPDDAKTAYLALVGELTGSSW